MKKEKMVSVFIAFRVANQMWNARNGQKEKVNAAEKTGNCSANTMRSGSSRFFFVCDRTCESRALSTCVKFIFLRPMTKHVFSVDVYYRPAYWQSRPGLINIVHRHLISSRMSFEFHRMRSRISSATSARQRTC